MAASDDLRAAAEDVVSELDGIARNYDHYEYGLPWDDAVRDEMAAAVLRLVGRVTPGWHDVPPQPGFYAIALDGESAACGHCHVTDPAEAGIRFSRYRWYGPIPDDTPPPAGG